MIHNREALDRARRLYHALCDAGEFTLVEFRDALRDELLPLAGEMFEDALERIKEEVDRAAARERSPTAEPTFPQWDMEGVYRLGDNRRVAKRKASYRQALEALAVDRQNRDAVIAAHRRKREELRRLRPYWIHPGVDKAAALARYLRDHPEDQPDQPTA